MPETPTTPTDKQTLLKTSVSDAYGTRISNPLTLIAVFAGIAETAAIAVLPILPESTQFIFVWYVMGFPALLVVLFFLTLNYNHLVLYSPSDYPNPEDFIKALKSISKTDDFASDPELLALGGQNTLAGNLSEILADYYFPSSPDTPATAKQRLPKLLKWMEQKDMRTLTPLMLVWGVEYHQERVQMVQDLELQTELTDVTNEMLQITP